MTGSESNKVTEESVDHPAHYNVGNIEVIDAIEAWQLDFNTGNAVKYIARAEHKGDVVEDLRKAVWYLQRAISNRLAKTLKDKSNDDGK